MARARKLAAAGGDEPDDAAHDQRQGLRDLLGEDALDNVIEELVGDIQDEFDVEEKEFHRISDTEFLVEGTLGLYELEDHDVNIEFEEDADVSTVGGYITHLMGQLPNLGDETRMGDYRATVAKTDGKRVVQIRFKKMTLEELKAEADDEAEAVQERLEAQSPDEEK